MSLGLLRVFGCGASGLRISRLSGGREEGVRAHVVAPCPAYSAEISVSSLGRCPAEKGSHRPTSQSVGRCGEEGNRVYAARMLMNTAEPLRAATVTVWPLASAVTVLAVTLVMAAPPASV